MFTEKELQFIHLEEGLKAYNDNNTLKMMAVYLASAGEAFEASYNPESFRPLMLKAANLSPEDAKSVTDFFLPRLEAFAVTWNKPYGASELAMVELMKTMKSLERLAPQAMESQS